MFPLPVNDRDHHGSDRWPLLDAEGTRGEPLNISDEMEKKKKNTTRRKERHRRVGLAWLGFWGPPPALMMMTWLWLSRLPRGACSPWRLWLVSCVEVWMGRCQAWAGLHHLSHLAIRSHVPQPSQECGMCARAAKNGSFAGEGIGMSGLEGGSGKRNRCGCFDWEPVRLGLNQSLNSISVRAANRTRRRRRRSIPNAKTWTLWQRCRAMA